MHNNADVDRCIPATASSVLCLCVCVCRGDVVFYSILTLAHWLSHCSEVAGLLLFVFRYIEFTCSVSTFLEVSRARLIGTGVLTLPFPLFHVIFGTAGVGSCGSDSPQSELIFHVFWCVPQSPLFLSPLPRWLCTYTAVIFAGSDRNADVTWISSITAGRN